MSGLTHQPVSIAIACGGTGGHLFPGIAVAEELGRCGCAVTLLISPKDVDQHAAQSASGCRIVTLPAIGLTRGRWIAFWRGVMKSYAVAKRAFADCPPRAVLAMGGFTSAPPVWAIKRSGGVAFLHESNTIPGRANRWLSWIVERAFVGFPEAAGRLHRARVTVTGTPVRSQFQPRDPGVCRGALGLDPGRETVLVMGGSQGATGLNDLVLRASELMARKAPACQWIHLAGAADHERVRQAYAASGLRAVVYPFLREMDVALGAATVAISRAGAASLAELAAMRVPALLVPYPAATDNHQWHNARAYETSGAALLVPQQGTTQEAFAHLLLELLNVPATRLAMQTALAAWHKPGAARDIAHNMLEVLERVVGVPCPRKQSSSSPESSNSGGNVPRSGMSAAPGFQLGQSISQSGKEAAV